MRGVRPGPALAGALAWAIAGAFGAPAHAAPEPVALHWLAGAPPAPTGVSWGVPWPRGAVRKDQSFRLSAAGGRALPVQTWPLAYWPDGSLKWSAFATVADGEAGGTLTLEAGPAAPRTGPAVRLQSDTSAVEVDTGAVKCRISRRGAILVESLEVEGRVVARGGRLLAVLQDGPEDVLSAPRREKYVGRVDDVSVEQSGPVRAVVRVRGSHGAAEGGRTILPYDLRLYFYAGQEPVRMVHTFVYDGDEQKDFIRGLGLAFAVPLREQVHNRHVRFCRRGHGLWSEPIQPATGRRDASCMTGRRSLSRADRGQAASRTRRSSAPRARRCWPTGRCGTLTSWCRPTPTASGSRSARIPERAGSTRARARARRGSSSWVTLAAGWAPA